MRAALLVGVGVAACGPGLNPAAPHEVGRKALVNADAAAIEKLLAGSVTVGGLWFEDPACAAEFHEGEVAAARLPAFARCLAGLHLQASAREDALGDVVIMTYAPGFEVEARVIPNLFGPPHLTWIGYESRRDDADNLPTITADALEALRTSGDRNGPLDPSIASALELDAVPASHAAFTWMKVCLDATGAVTSARPHETTSSKGSAAFSEAAAKWTFRPFMAHGQPVPVCAMVRMTYPAGQGPTVETIPFPPPRSKSKREPVVLVQGTKILEGKRIGGDKNITPDDDTKTAIQRSGVKRFRGSFRICVDETGHVESVLPLRSTGLAAYDQTLMRSMRAWVYSPYLIEDQPVPVCTAVTFIYSQR